MTSAWREELAMSDFGKVCEHGSLKRKCPHCEYAEAEQAYLAKITEQAAALTAAQEDKGHVKYLEERVAYLEDLVRRINASNTAAQERERVLVEALEAMVDEYAGFEPSSDDDHPCDVRARAALSVAGADKEKPE